MVFMWFSCDVTSPQNSRSTLSQIANFWFSVIILAKSS